MSEIDGDLDDLLTISHLLFRENRRLRRIKYQHIRVDWEQHVNMLDIQMSSNRDFGCLGVCLMI